LIDARARSERKNVGLALILSAGLHLLAVSTLDLAPGSWRHGLRPALKVYLRPAPPESALGEAASPASTLARERKEESGIASTRAQSGSSVPTGIRYYRNSEVDVQAEPIVQAPLVIPEQAYVSKLRGTVRAHVFIDEDGSVVSVRVVEARPVRGVFEDAAREALRQVRYKPALIAGQPVKSQKLIEVTFNPYEEPAPAAR
jgi:TonB family protein